ncbi:Ig-like domain-containing protein [Streptomyces sp. NBC_00264]|uniref:Ig-like domain-containing protein n=1 Tax=unclassified Streptomyces TaxID=2593676 RepID=UPI000F5BF441|nr:MULTISPECIES: Ig-like domain-containing protein [unclassified Streptomyces]WSG54091.1 Ig-like domain-containing protein [Streptomyces sp. NBC_01732]WSX04721.1 Ig-like domain-containing protein [Streptomyces sp. NBC_00987]MCX4392997.1 Ig-like domain-containing protein [Streptomyces sp. NBC_01767]MCX5105116.1 Ig-like domain-containing protein [Streptomyces sp. NBC_00439]MCX5163832.1 Ig-like domain-containing protein [Streptomyces sp. NBC_00305]
MSTFTLAGLRSVQQDNPSIVAHLELRSDADPRLPVEPGRRIGFEWILRPQGDGTRYYGYLMADSFASVATIENMAGMSLLPSGERYATSTGPGAERVARFTLRVHRHAAPDAFLVPVLRAGIIADGGKSLTSTTFSLKNHGFRIAPLPPQGRSATVAPGQRAVLTDLTAGLGEHVGLAGVGPARHGVTSVGPDGTVTYHPFDGHLGYDWFDYVLDAGGGRLVPGRVTVHVGDLGMTPGLLGGWAPGP